MKVKILHATAISPTAKLYTLTAVEGDYFFQPGQFISFLIPRNKGQSVRAYSFCSLPQELPKIELCVREVPGGVGTTYLGKNIGQVVETSGPQGDFVLPASPNRDGSEEYQPLVFLVSGTGIAPVRPQLKFWLGQHAEAEVWLAYRFSGPSEYLFQDELEGLAKQYEQFEIHPWESRVESYDQLTDPRFYIVGPPSFVKQNTGKLIELGYNKEKIKYDIWE